MIEHNFEQRTAEWHQARNGFITGTSLKDALGSKVVQKTLLYKKVAERMTEPVNNFFLSDAMLRGIELEAEAVVYAQIKTGLKFEALGFIASDDIPYFGMSPDGVYREFGEVVGGIEIKCPHSATHIKHMLEKKLPDDYKFQVYAPFLISDKIQWWIFMSYDDRVYGQEGYMIKIHRKDIADDLAEAKEKLIEYMAKIKTTHEGLAF